MRFVAVKSEQAQAAAVVFRTRDLLVRQRTQAINALRGHLAEFGVIAAKGPVQTSKLIAAIEDPACDLPQAARGILAVLVEELRSLDERVAVQHPTTGHTAPEDFSCSRRGVHTCRKLYSCCPVVVSSETWVAPLSGGPFSWRFRNRVTRKAPATLSNVVRVQS